MQDISSQFKFLKSAVVRELVNDIRIISSLCNEVCKLTEDFGTEAIIHKAACVGDNARGK